MAGRPAADAPLTRHHWDVHVSCHSHPSPALIPVLQDLVTEVHKHNLHCPTPSPLPARSLHHPSFFPGLLPSTYLHPPARPSSPV